MGWFMTTKRCARAEGCCAERSTVGSGGEVVIERLSPMFACVALLLPWEESEYGEEDDDDDEDEDDEWWR